MTTYQKFCIYCNELIPGDSNICPICENQSPFSMRCPKCNNPVQKNWKICSSCGIRLTAKCTGCKKEVPTAQNCKYCGTPILVRCSNKKCLEVQILTEEKKCMKCKTNLEGVKK